jgi:arylsulfatase A-like enzyme
MAARPADKPWCFWYGSVEPHRRYEYGSGVAKGGKKLEDIEKVFEYWPDSEVTRNDLLDYAFEIEYFDSHVVRMLELLEKEGELDNTVVFVTADHGMPFPRVKGQEYERSNHVPLAIMWKNGIKNPGRVAAEYVSFIDLAPTFVELAGLDWNAIGLAPSPGRSLTDIFADAASAERDHVLMGKERHDIGRPHDWGYPIRGIIKGGMLYIHNFESTRWPAGNPETGYPNTDASPTKTEVLNSRTAAPEQPYWKLSFGKRPEEELYDIAGDPDCMKNLADDPGYAERKEALKAQLMDELTAQQDPRARGNGGVFENYPVAFERLRNFHERFTKGEVPKAGWINETDIEKEPLE